MIVPSATRQWPLSKSHLMDLPEELLTSILKQLPLKAKCQAQAVCQTFRDILSKPYKGSLLWESIQIDDPILQAASPYALARWLVQRANGIQKLWYAAGDFLKRPWSDLEREGQVVTWVLPQLSALLPPAAEIHLTLCWAFAEQFHANEELLLTLSPGEYRVQPCWVGLASSLTKLRLTLRHDVGHATISALNVLTRLQNLTLSGAENSTGTYPRAYIQLSLPELEKLIVGHFSHISILLNCPMLEILGLVALYPLVTLQGIPQEIEMVALTGLAEGSVSPLDIFGWQELEYVERLFIVGWPHIYQDSEALEIVKRAFRNGSLRHFKTDYPLEKLTPLHGPGCALPISLRVLELHLPLEKGLPKVLEQLTNLRKLTLHHIGEGPMHLDRSLDPFLNMTGFKTLIFSSRYKRQGAGPLEFTPNASKFLELASKRIEEGNLLPYGRDVVLKYSGED